MRRGNPPGHTPTFSGLARSRLRLTEWEDLHKAQFLNAIDIVLTALSEHILRFARLARDMAQRETRDWRRTELLAIADNCDLIAHRPPQTFWQALHRPSSRAPALKTLQRVEHV